MVMHGVYLIFICLGVGYMLCAAAAKEKGSMKVLGYSLGVAILILTLVSGFITIDLRCPMLAKIMKLCSMNK